MSVQFWLNFYSKGVYFSAEVVKLCNCDIPFFVLDFGQVSCEQDHRCLALC